MHATKLISRCHSFILGHIVAVYLFCWLVISIPLGDGRQGFIEVVSCGAILGLWGITRWLLPQQRRLPSSLAVWWYILIGYCAVILPFSHGLGFSISANIRMYCGFAMFYFLYTITKRDHLTGILAAILGFSLLACVTALLLAIFPSWSLYLPLMNYVFPIYGHNYLANILLIAIPLSQSRLIPPHTRIVLGSIFFLSLVFSFSRGALLIISVYIGWLWYGKSKLMNPKSVMKRYYPGVLILLVLLAAGYLLIFEYMSHHIFPPGFITKTSIIQLSRLNYIQQAINGIRDSPLVGYGAGTFSLLSKYQQVSTGTHSWFAHNSILQATSELGLIGLGIILMLGYRLFRHWKRGAKENTRTETLTHAIILTLGYSLFEFNLDFLIIWIILWTLIGTVLSETTRQPPQGGGRPLTALWVMIPIAVYYTLGFSSIISLRLYPDNRTLGYLVAPFSQEKALTLVLAGPIDPATERVIRTFHAGDYEIYQALAATKTGQERIPYQRIAASLEPARTLEIYSEEYLKALPTTDAADIVNLSVYLQRTQKIHCETDCLEYLTKQQLLTLLRHTEPMINSAHLTSREKADLYFWLSTLSVSQFNLTDGSRYIDKAARYATSQDIRELQAGLAALRSGFRTDKDRQHILSLRNSDPDRVYKRIVLSESLYALTETEGLPGRSALLKDAIRLYPWKLEYYVRLLDTLEQQGAESEYRIIMKQCKDSFPEQTSCGESL